MAQPTTAVYLRVSSKTQDCRSQEPDLRVWANTAGEQVLWVQDRFTGRTLDRPGWAKVWEGVQAGRIRRIVVWRLDRLGRTVTGLAQLFEDLQARRVDLVSVKDGLSLSTPAGRLMAHVLASVAVYELEVRAERQLAGIAAAKAAGKKWGGRKPGTRVRVTVERERTVRRLRADGRPIAEIARVVGLSRRTVYRVLADGAGA